MSPEAHASRLGPNNTTLQIDQRVPLEVWQRIFNNLYPSQLCRLSMVNRHFNQIVSSLMLWTRLFPLIFGETKRLRTLGNIPESKSHMLYICANSLFICETCLGLTENQLYYHKPKPVLAPLPTMSKKDADAGGVQFLGEELNRTWMIWMCAPCRDKQEEESKLKTEGPDDPKTQERIRWYREQHSYKTYVPLPGQLSIGDTLERQDRYMYNFNHFS
ncbi:hypothetical protein BGZ70_000045 [Mortierella alpina]|uniref:F-box domain-containing protein n=1 Tax=Mortierella alpina TaxID=64518 RepID=A0A9P6M658_MORAP|nr:hypothetical protein BGZ70_000045 [Mortierella alpina]